MHVEWLAKIQTGISRAVQRASNEPETFFFSVPVGRS
jgi:hypothetical protein